MGSSASKDMDCAIFMNVAGISGARRSYDNLEVTSSLFFFASIYHDCVLHDSNAMKYLKVMHFFQLVFFPC